ncbi:5'/3'-nucleotidase SurE [Candidatus Poribacteria bacterium]|nr:5'/3'-nucleotidase SurE [Candidatus Poribacteria bacterium]
MIFITNDDGIHAPGINHLADALSTLDDVFVVAPDRERSAIGMAITLSRPLRAKDVAPGRVAVDGTPVDCVDLAIGALLPEAPRLLVAGINHGENLGHDVHFSGTVAAARKGAFLGLPSIAVSLSRSVDAHWDTACEFARRIVKTALVRAFSPGVLLNVNVPNLPLHAVKGVRVTRQDPAPYTTHVETRLDKEGVPYYWIGGARVEIDDRDDTDFGSLRTGWVSITPLHADMTHYESLEPLREWEP